MYNIVSLEKIDVVEEMISHFKRFWAEAGSIEKCIDQIKEAIDSREQEVIQGFHKDADPETRTAQFRKITVEVQKSADDFAAKLRTLPAQDFIFGFHPAPYASVGHLHMHVLAAPPDFRRYSTGAHDWKTVPAEAVMEAIIGERGGLE